VREEAPARTPAAPGLAPPDGAHVGAPRRHHLCRGDLAGQTEPSPCAPAGRARHLCAQWGQPEGGPQHEYARRWGAPVPVDPRLQGSRRRQASRSGASRVYRTGLQRLRRAQRDKPECAHARLHALRVHARPQCERGAQHRMARATPAGSPGSGGGAEPRTRRAVPPAECQQGPNHT
jgi:hypothetical protein